MFYKECQKYRFSFLLVLSVFLGLLFTSCSGDPNKHIARGEELLKQRKFQAAVMEFKSAADIDKYSVGAHWGLARAREGQGDVFETINELRTVVSLDAKHLDAKTKLGNYFLLVNPPQFADAEQVINEIFAIDPNFIEGFVLKASLLSAQNKPEADILAVLDHAISLDPKRVESYLSLARFFMKKDKADEAENTIKKAISANPDIALGYLEYGRFFTYTDRAQEAEAQFRRAIEVEPKSIEPRESLAGFYLSQRQIDKAEQAFKELAEIQGNGPEGRMQLADFYATVDRDDDAIATFQEILTDWPEFVRARYRLSEIYLERQENEKVLEQIEKLLGFNDGDAEALMLRARVRMQENRADEAVKDLEDVLKKQPSLRTALFYMVQARLALGQVDQARAFIGDLEKYHPKYIYTKLLKVQSSFAASESLKALTEANELLETAKRSIPGADVSQQQLEQLKIQALSARGQAFLGLGKINEARADFQEILKRSPRSASSYSNLARVELASKNYVAAQDLYEKAFLVDKRNFEALNGIVAVFKRQKQFSEAQARIDKVLAESALQNDILASLHYLKADVFMASKDYASAESELQTSIELDNGYLPSYSAFASVLVAQNQIDRAIEQYKKLVEKKPSSAIYSLIGMLEDARQNFAEAERNYREAIKITPGTPIASNNLAWIIAAYDKGNLDEALTLAQSSVNKNSNIPSFYDTLGLVYFKKGLSAPAVEQFKKAVALEDSEATRTGSVPNPAYRVRLATALVSAGDKLNARKEVEIALQNAKDLSQDDAREAKRVLESL